MGGIAIIVAVFLLLSTAATGMAYWGTIFSEEETWGIVDYLWTFLFEEAKME